MQIMTANNPNLDLVNINAYIKFSEILSICSQDIERKQYYDVNQGPLLRYKCVKSKCNNPKLDLVNMKAYIESGEILSICSQDIERKRNSGVKGHNSGTNMGKMTGNNPNLDLIIINAYTKFGEILSFCSQDIKRNRNFE